MASSADRGAAPPPLPRRDRLWVLLGMGGVTLLAWVYLVDMARGMGAMDMGSMMGLRPWIATDFALMFLMWAVMMVGMMVPSAIPMALPMV